MVVMLILLFFDWRLMTLRHIYVSILLERLLLLHALGPCMPQVVMMMIVSWFLELMVFKLTVVFESESMAVAVLSFGVDQLKEIKLIQEAMQNIWEHLPSTCGCVRQFRLGA